MSVNATIPTVGGANSQKCRDYALFYHVVPEAVFIFAPFVFGGLAVVFSLYLYNNTPLDKPKEEAASPDADAEATSIPLETIVASSQPGSEAPSLSIDGEAPPPYAPPENHAKTPVIPTIVPPQDTTVVKKRTSAEAFVLGCALFFCNILFLILSALGIQAIVYCFDGEPIGRAGRIFFWCLYVIPCNMATLAVACWLILLRNLFGPKVIKKYPIAHENIPLIVPGLISVPFVIVYFVGLGVWKVVVLVGGLVGRGAVRVVEVCQRTLCGDALEEVDTSSQQDVELGEENFTVGDDDDERINGTVTEQERAGLITGTEK